MSHLTTDAGVTSDTSELASPSLVPLSQAPVHVQLAVDLIYLLEQQQLPTETVLHALDIVQRDFARKAAKT